ncbi:MAG: 30S ribosomal protein S2 [Candidatus Pacearchaeota archaeon]
MAKQKKEQDYLVNLDLYIKTKVYVGHKIITPDMRKYVFKRKGDGVAVFNTDIIDQKIREAINYISKFQPEDIIVVGKNPKARKAIEMFSFYTGIKAFTSKYPAGILTNPNLENFLEPKLVLIVDPIIDKNALKDANKVKIPVLALCNSNTYTKGIDFVLPVNNREESSLGLVFYLLAKGYLEALGIKKEVKIEDFIDIEKIKEKTD